MSNKPLTRADLDSWPMDKKGIFERTAKIAILMDERDALEKLAHNNAERAITAEAKCEEIRHEVDSVAAERDQLAAALDIFKGKVQALEMERDEALSELTAARMALSSVGVEAGALPGLIEALKGERDEARQAAAKMTEHLDGMIRMARAGASVEDIGEEAINAREVHPSLGSWLRTIRGELAEARAEGARLREALEACGYWLHPVGFNTERQRLFDRITNSVMNSHSLWNFLRVALDNRPSPAAEWLAQHDAAVVKETESHYVALLCGEPVDVAPVIFDALLARDARRKKQWDDEYECPNCEMEHAKAESAYGRGLDHGAADAGEKLRERVKVLMGSMEIAWGIIANAFGGDWGAAPPEWKGAAERWRDEHWHPVLGLPALSTSTADKGGFPALLGQMPDFGEKDGAPRPRCDDAMEAFAFGAERARDAIRALSNQAPPKSHVVHRVIEEGLAPVCQTKGTARTTTDEAEVTCRRCLVLFGWIPPARRDEHALDEAKTARAGQCSCSVGPCVHQKIRETFESPPKSQADGAPKSVTVPVLPVDDATEARYEKLLAEKRAPPVCPTCKGKGRIITAMEAVHAPPAPMAMITVTAPCPDCGGGK